MLPIETVYKTPIKEKSKAYNLLEDLAIAISHENADYLRKINSFISIVNRLEEKCYAFDDGSVSNEEPSLWLCVSANDYGALTNTYLHCISPRTSDGLPAYFPDSENNIVLEDHTTDYIMDLEHFLLINGFKQVTIEEFNDFYQSKT